MTFEQQFKISVWKHHIEDKPEAQPLLIADNHNVVLEKVKFGDKEREKLIFSFTNIYDANELYNAFIRLEAHPLRNWIN